MAVETPNVIHATLSLLPTSAPGRRGPVYSAYRGSLFFGQRDSDGHEMHHDAMTFLDDVDELAPGETAYVTIFLAAPELQPERQLQVGATFDLKEGVKVVGRGEIRSVGRDDRPVAERMADFPLSPLELNTIERRADEASPGPWESFIERCDHLAGDDFIRTGGYDDDGPDMYVTLAGGRVGSEPVSAGCNDLDFIAGARQDVPRLIAEVRRLSKRLSSRAE
jgi:hypothetical protein